MGWCRWWRVGGEISEGIKLSAAPGTPLTQCNPEMKVREDGVGGDFIDFERFKFFFDERMSFWGSVLENKGFRLLKGK